MILFTKNINEKKIFFVVCAFFFFLGGGGSRVNQYSLQRNQI